MCGRTACTLAPDELCKACSKKDFSVGWRDHPGSQSTYFPSYNVAPTSYTPVIFSGKHMERLAGKEEEIDEDYVMQPMMWSLVPHFYKGSTPKSHGFKTNNCRVETIDQKPMFSVLLKKAQRCVVLCDGFYEWQTQDKIKTPYLIYAPQPQHVRVWDPNSWKEADDVKPGGSSSDWQGLVPLKMAGIFSRWRSTEGEEVWSYSVITMEASKGFSWLHHRVPVILQTDQDVKDWLDVDVDHQSVLDRITGSPDVKWHQVSSEVNNSRNNTLSLMKPVDPKSKPSTPSSKLMTSWLSKGSFKKSTNTSDADKLDKNQKRKSSTEAEYLQDNKKIKKE